MTKLFSSFLLIALLLADEYSTRCHAAELRPNVLFIAVDDLKPALGCYGHALANTPRIDEMAGRGMIFTRAYCQWPVCGPSRASLMSSLRPESSGVMDLKTDIRAKNSDVLTLPQHFRAHGYTTAGTGKIYDPRCVDNKKDCDKPSWTIPFVTPKATREGADTGDDGSGKPVLEAPDCSDTDLIDGQIALSGVKLMRELTQTRKPFFLAVGFKKPHLPFSAPKKYWDLYDREKLPLAEYREGITGDSGYVLHESAEFRGYDGVPKSGPIPESLQRECLHGYLACVSYVDAQVGLLLDELKQSGLEKNTVIVLWGDHGFHLGDHGMWGKHSTLENAARVPLVIVPPQGTSTRKNESPVEFTDIYPTLCSLANLPIPAELQGRSLQTLLTGQAMSVRNGALTVFKNRGAIGYSYRTERYRYTEWINKAGKPVAFDLFDYENDPLESKNIAEAADPALLRQLKAALRRESQGCERLQSSQMTAR